MSKLLNIFLLSALGLASGCAMMDGDRGGSADTYKPSEVGTVQETEQVESGRIVSLEPVDIEDEGIEAGTVIGAVAGGLAGRQVGGGTGRDIMTVIGAAAGGYAGSRYDDDARAAEAVRIGLQMQDGREIAIVQELDKDDRFRVGEQVEVVFNGNKAEVVHDDTEVMSYGMRDQDR